MHLRLSFLLIRTRPACVLLDSSTVQFLSVANEANGDPRLAFAAATEIVTNPEAENRLLGFFGGISSEESKAVQVAILCSFIFIASFLTCYR